MAKGFASLSKLQRHLVSGKGGKAVQLAGTGHKFTALNSKAAAARSVAARRKKRAMAAAKVLLAAGLTPYQIDSLKLSEDELIYYGGSKRNRHRLEELLVRLKEAKHD